MASTLLEVARKIEAAFLERNAKALRKINDKCVQEIALEFSEEMYNLALLSYMLSKIVAKPRFWGKGFEKYARKIEESIRGCVSAAERKDMEEFREKLRAALGAGEAMDYADRRFVSDVFEKAKLKTAAILYAQGFSLGRASEITGIDKREILEYAGKTMMFDRVKAVKSISERLRRLRKIFR